ncbi:flavodoxin family protein [Bacillus sp. T3]|uniref:flavodoxin family protein n=1 Tax=Bacillus sp. T3 TaxID=467262 RepID=UPI002981FFCC|nr:flavodoxin family protein [Bacillus sp. T3]
MKIGVIIHSQTNHTYFVAQRLKEELSATGHSVSIVKIIAANDREQDINKIKLENTPDVSEYDGIIFGAPVRGFALSPILTAYLTGMNTLRGKKVECYVTQFFRYPWMGGNRAIKQMKNICEEKDANVIGTGIINWSSKKRKVQIEQMAEKQKQLFV